ncbi:hypothetical protein GTP55_21860 [Duganella sp. FT109W]|uniref:Uncharacterized protein n=1 Tax=Duganella margarita TaxID=2692170 RepID=A0ABW9WPP9_9BURK|nr:STY0301 family protein [Duganella margarita]MYN42005.1 hypothetical protein [Duganella margarita]
MKAYAKVVLVTMPVLVAPSVCGAEQSVICPTEISQASIKLTGVPPQWTPYVASPLYLFSAGAAAGPPEQLATLMGDSTWKKGASEWTTTYDLNDASFSAGKWMECRYGEYGQVVLSRQLDAKTNSCTVQFSKGEKAGQRTLKIICQ